MSNKQCPNCRYYQAYRGHVYQATDDNLVWAGIFTVAGGLGLFALILYDVGATHMDIMALDKTVAFYMTIGVGVLTLLCLLWFINKLRHHVPYGPQEYEWRCLNCGYAWGRSTSEYG